jgi:hypothetical protein
MTKVYYVEVQIKAPCRACPNGQFAFGHYTIVDGVLVMTDADGEPVVDGDGKRYTHKLRDSDNHQVIGAVLTRELRTALRGGTVNGFDGPINYGPQPRWR